MKIKRALKRSMRLICFAQGPKQCWAHQLAAIYVFPKSIDSLPFRTGIRSGYPRSTTHYPSRCFPPCISGDTKKCAKHAMLLMSVTCALTCPSNSLSHSLVSFSRFVCGFKGAQQKTQTVPHNPSYLDIIGFFVCSSASRPTQLATILTLSHGCNRQCEECSSQGPLASS